jgi:hypothetical protein
MRRRNRKKVKESRVSLDIRSFASGPTLRRVPRLWRSTARGGHLRLCAHGQPRASAGDVEFRCQCFPFQRTRISLASTCWSRSRSLATLVRCLRKRISSPRSQSDQDDQSTPSQIGSGDECGTLVNTSTCTWAKSAIASTFAERICNPFSVRSCANRASRKSNPFWSGKLRNYLLFNSATGLVYADYCESALAVYGDKRNLATRLTAACLRQARRFL